jgi:hypothetical protein
MANMMPLVVVRMFSTAKTRAMGLGVIYDTMCRALTGDADAASAALLMSAEILRQERTYPPELVPFLILALDATAKSEEACRAVATAGGGKIKKGAPTKRSEDSEVFAHELALREEIPKKAARVKFLANQYKRKDETIRTMLKRASKSKRLIDKLLCHVDALLAAETEG